MTDYGIQFTIIDELEHNPEQLPANSEHYIYVKQTLDKLRAESRDLSERLHKARIIRELHTGKGNNIVLRLTEKQDHVVLNIISTKTNYESKYSLPKRKINAGILTGKKDYYDEIAIYFKPDEIKAYGVNKATNKQVDLHISNSEYALNAALAWFSHVALHGTKPKNQAKNIN